MKRIFKTLAGMACIIGALAASSCSKDEFFGLEGSQVVSASTMNEIAMSQEFTNYAKACLALTQTMSEEIDTTAMESFINEKGKRVYYKDGVYSEYSVSELMEILKKAYPELEKADMTDFDEILQIALAKNEALSDFAVKASVNNTKSGWIRNSLEWLRNAHRNYYDLDYTPQIWSTDIDGVSLTNYDHLSAAVSNALYATVDTQDYWYGGYFWNDYSAVLASSCSPYWPDIAEYASPVPEADFLVLPFPEDYAYQVGEYYIDYQDYRSHHRIHYIYFCDGNYWVSYND